MGAVYGQVGDVEDGVVGRALDLLAHRGDDTRRIRKGPSLTLAELGTGGSKTVATSGDGNVACVMNGRLFNRRELGLELETAGMSPPFESDPEIVANLYRVFGQDAFRRLDGAFALALTDQVSLYLVRDPLGEKPLYYAPNVAGALLFSSEIKAFLAHPGFEVRPDLGALSRLLAFSFIPGKGTAFNGVQELEPGSLLRRDLGRGELELFRYWDLEEKVEDRTESEWIESLRTELSAAIRRRLPPDSVEIGAFLSGGIDSSAVVALLAELGRPPICYSVSFGHGEPNELLYATLVTTHLGLEHRVIDVEPATFIDLLPRIMWSLDDPLCDCITVPNFMLAQIAAREVPVIFNGEGGDPLFGGPKNKFMILGEWYSFFGGYERSRAYLFSYHKFFDYFEEALTPEFWEQSGGTRALEEHVEGLLDNPGIENFLNRLMHVNIRLKGGQNILVKVDKMLSPHGVEACSPLFDRRLAELSFRMPTELKRRGDIEKYVFKKAVDDSLPAPVVYRKKAGMGVPLNPWFRKNPLRRYARDILSSERARQRGYFKQGFVDRLLHGELPVGHLGRDRSGELLWMMLAIEIWHRVFVDGERP